MRILASRLHNRVELWRREKVETDIGEVTKPVLVRKLWADIIPTNTSEKDGPADTEKAEAKIKSNYEENRHKKIRLYRS